MRFLTFTAAAVLTWNGAQGFVAPSIQSRPTFTSIPHSTQLSPATPSTLSSFTSSSLKSIQSDEFEGGGFLEKINVPYLAFYAAFLTFAFTLAPGEVNSASDTALINELLSNPLHPDTNHLWFTIWNYFAVVPLSLAALLLPGAKKSSALGLPPSPFIAGAGALGFFSLGPLMITRKAATDVSKSEDCGFFTRNVFESKPFAVILTLLAFSVPFTSGLASDFIAGEDFSCLVNGFVDLASSSRFVTVATSDLIVMSAISASLIPEDRERRGMDPTLPIYALLPGIGPCIHIFLRDELPE
ncbi:hypothetical protein TrVE_jg1802 [Triparma verrucosa]|uniref:Uncharacterized protein n=1 Tax=Triparma verrucosa TaxID=1606542 RepID=A0A9W7C4M6_9STRA|nr:hypothetical protein TrVE_jg1802 [Triparma verrucosa]